MTTAGDHDRAAFQALAAVGAEDNSAPRALAARLRAELEPSDLKALAALWIHGAAAAPERIPDIYDAAAEGWFGEPVEGPPIKTVGGAPEPIPPTFWDGLWNLDRDPQMAGKLTTSAAALASRLPPVITQRVARAAFAYPDVQTAISRGRLERFNLDTLRRCPPDSLAGALYRRVSERGVEVEPLGGERRDGAPLPQPLDYLNARLLQCHDLWRIVAGYETTALHEVAVLAFQLAQFGNHHASVFLGSALTRLAFEQPEGGPILLESILGAWAHGRRSPSLLPVRWESMWDQSVEAVRAKLGVTPYPSPFPADLFERPGAADAA